MTSMPNARTNNHQGGLREELTLAARRFGAWWEGYDFDPAHERQRLRMARAASGPQLAYSDHIAMTIWGEGRLDPGSPAWTMRHARVLSAPLKAKIAVLGAGAGAPLQDLKDGTKWRVNGYSQYADQAPGMRLETYETATARINRAFADAGLCFFDLHRRRDPQALTLFAAEVMKPGAPVCFVDFAAARRGVRLGTCFMDPLPGALRTVEQTTQLIEAAGFRLSDSVDESRAFAPLIAKGFARWRRAHHFAQTLSDDRQQAEYLSTLGRIAHIWAERFDALRAGQLRVMRYQARRL